LIDDYELQVAMLTSIHPIDKAMSMAVGGNYDETGSLQADLLESLGLKDRMSVVDLGCGSGRTAKYLGKRFPNLSYTGIDIVQALLDYAKQQCPDHFRFIRNTDVKLPVRSAGIDMVVAFSLFTHLLHEETFCYLQESHRALRGGGTLVFSFLQFGQPHHWTAFEDALWVHKRKKRRPLNVFIEEDVIGVWAEKIGFVVETMIRDHPLGQTIAVLRKP